MHRALRSVRCPRSARVRRSREAFDPLFFEKSPSCPGPSPEPRAPSPTSSTGPRSRRTLASSRARRRVRFEKAVPPPRRHRRTPLDLGALYDARIVTDALSPHASPLVARLLERARVGRFPEPKWALHERQHRASSSRAWLRTRRGFQGRGPASTTRSRCWTRGGVVKLVAPSGEGGGRLRPRALRGASPRRPSDGGARRGVGHRGATVRCRRVGGPRGPSAREAPSGRESSRRTPCRASRSAPDLPSVTSA